MTDGTDTGAASAPAAPPAASSAPAARQGAIADNTYQRLSQADQARYAQVRAGPDGGSEWVERDQLPSATDSPSTVPADTAKPADPNATHKIGDLEVSQAELQEYMQSKAAAELKRASLPQTPADYRPDLPPDFQMPAGITEFKFDTTDPLFTSAQAWAHSARSIRVRSPKWSACTPAPRRPRPRSSMPRTPIRLQKWAPMARCG
jgi:hypothetical protein